MWLVGRSPRGVARRWQRASDKCETHLYDKRRQTLALAEALF